MMLAWQGWWGMKPYLGGFSVFTVAWFWTHFKSCAQNLASQGQSGSLCALRVASPLLISDPPFALFWERWELYLWKLSLLIRQKWFDNLYWTPMNQQCLYKKNMYLFHGIFTVGLTEAWGGEKGSSSPRIPPSRSMAIHVSSPVLLARGFHSVPRQRHLFPFLVILCPSGWMHRHLLSVLFLPWACKAKRQSREWGTLVSLCPLDSRPFWSHSIWTFTQ